jgi:hypothetical protein
LKIADGSVSIGRLVVNDIWPLSVRSPSRRASLTNPRTALREHEDEPAGDDAGPMARTLRIQYAGGVYHVMNRGGQREAILHDDQNRRRFGETLAEAAPRPAGRSPRIASCPIVFLWWWRRPNPIWGPG